MIYHSDVKETLQYFYGLCEEKREEKERGRDRGDKEGEGEIGKGDNKGN